MFRTLALRRISSATKPTVSSMHVVADRRTVRHFGSRSFAGADVVEKARKQLPIDRHRLHLGETQPLRGEVVEQSRAIARPPAGDGPASRSRRDRRVFRLPPVASARRPACCPTENRTASRPARIASRQRKHRKHRHFRWSRHLRQCPSCNSFARRCGTGTAVTPTPSPGFRAWPLRRFPVPARPTRRLFTKRSTSSSVAGRR